MIHLEAGGPGDAITKTQELCSENHVLNLVLTFPLAIAETNLGVLATYRAEALLWQEKVRPRELEFNHGEYMYAYGDPLEYLITQLTIKPTSNRACISVVGNNEILTSGDGALPSFLLLQVGFDGPRRDVLHLTAYYRALEVTAFLPFNIAELALISETISRRIPAIETINVTIHAFRAHSVPGNSVHHKSRIDVATPDEIHAWVVKNDTDRISDLLEEKSRPASIVNSSGLVALRVEFEQAQWSYEVRRKLDAAIAALAVLQMMRESDTHGDRISATQNEVTGLLRSLAEMVANEPLNR